LDTLDTDGLLEVLRDCGQLAPGLGARFSPLAGGVSADVFRVDTDDGRTLVVKRSIPRLRVAAEWLAPVQRAAGEVRWLRLARSIDPRLAPEVLAEAPEAFVFVMAYLDPARHPVWKDSMAAGHVDPAFAAAVGRDLARIALAADLSARRIALMHGDVSPKNILVGPEGPVFLDAECVGYGDPAFDVAFCLTHLLLKTVWLPRSREPLLASFDELRRAYLAGAAWEPAPPLDRRVAAFVSALLLARIDGKSPASYLVAPEDKGFVRAMASTLLAVEDIDLDDLADRWRAALAA
jgi:tRNA A-37 threonylcarbamoyl transferase component Bud32